MVQILDPNGHGIFWGKWDGDRAFLSLRDHSCDVAAVVYELLKHTLLGRRLAHLAGLKKLTEAQIHALCFFAVLHDFGKASIPFQLIPYRDPKSPLFDPSLRDPSGWSGPRGHVPAALAVLANPDYAISRQLLQHFRRPCDGPEGPNLSFLTCLVCHHGVPYQPKGSLNPVVWQTWNGLDPAAEVERLADAAKLWFPESQDPDATLPYENAAFQSLWNGILTKADWIASSELCFPFQEDGDTKDRRSFAKARAEKIVRRIGLNVQRSRSSLKEPPSFARISPHPPRAAQRAVGALPISRGGSTVILEAGTGSGKTEAAMWRFGQLLEAGEVDGFFFALPTRSAAVQIHGRLQTMIRDLLLPNVPEQDRPAVSLAVPGYLRFDDLDGTLLSRLEVEWSQDASEQQRLALRGWSSEQSKRYTSGAFVVGTIDQALLSALKVRHAHLRSAGLSRHLLIVDEVHASDSYMGTILRQVLARHRARGGHAFLMSATLGSKARYFFLNPEANRRSWKMSLEEACSIPLPMIQMQRGDLPPDEPIAIEDRESTAFDRRTLEFKLDRSGFGAMSDPKKVAALALEKARQGAKVLVIRNTVKDCRETQAQLERLATELGCSELLFGVRHEVTGDKIAAPHHSRFDPNARRALDLAIEAFFHPARRDRRGGVAVATQTVEQSLDIDADFMITDLCPMDVLLQRLGRLFRHEISDRPEGFESPQVTVLTPELALSQLIKKDGGSFGVHGLGGFVYSDIRILQATRELLEARASIRLPQDCRELVERATHETVLKSIGRENPDLGSHWKRHSQDVQGRELQERRLAKSAVMPTNKCFGEFSIDEDLDRAIQTRLGTRDILVSVPDGAVGPFGQPVDTLKIRPYDLGKEDLKLDGIIEAQVVGQDMNPLRLEIAGVSFVYDSLGIH